MAEHKTIIVVPCFNEADRLPVKLFAGQIADDASTRFLFVDDGSTDATGEVLGTLCEQHPEHVQVLSLEQNSGKSEAVRQGMLCAMSADAQYVGFWDADLATPLDEIAPMRQILESREELVGAIGSRIRLLGRNIERRTTRHYTGRIFATIAGMILKVPVYDTQCGAKLFRNGEATRSLFGEPFVSRWVFDVELVARLRVAHRDGDAPPIESSLVEVPLSAWHDVAGSKLRFHHMLGALLDLLRIRRRYQL